MSQPTLRLLDSRVATDVGVILLKNMHVGMIDNLILFFFFFQAEDGIRDLTVTGVQTCALPICKDPNTQDRRRRLHLPCYQIGYEKNSRTDHDADHDRYRIQQTELARKILRDTGSPGRSQGADTIHDTPVKRRRERVMKWRGASSLRLSF